mgnify:CR=1 FL=1
MAFGFCGGRCAVARLSAAGLVAKKVGVMDVISVI